MTQLNNEFEKWYKEKHFGYDFYPKYYQFRKEVKEAFEAGWQAALAEIDKCEPVAWISDDENFIEFRKDSLLELSYKENEIFPLYTSLPQQQWVGLSDDDVMEITWGLEDTDDLDIFTSDYAKAIEAKLKELNT